MKILIPCLAIFLLVGAADTRPQSQDSPSSPAKTADSQNGGSAPSVAKPKPKKVWTNEDMGSVKGDVSVVGDGHSSAKSEQKPSTNADQVHQKQIENYRRQIEQYQGQIQAIDKRMDQLKNFKADNTSPSGGISINHGYNMVPLDEQVKQLEEKKKQLEAKIEDTENDARKNGIEPGELR